MRRPGREKQDCIDCTGVQSFGRGGVEFGHGFGGVQRLPLQLEAGAGEDDTVLEYGDVKVFIDAGSMVHLNGVIVDYVESVGGAGFKFDNPNATSTCGCGSSFSTSSCSSKPAGASAEGGHSCGSGHHHH